MAFLGNLKIRTISIAGNLLLGLAAVGGGIASVVGVGAMKEQVVFIDENTVPSIAQIGDVSIGVMEARFAMSKLILASTDVARQEQDGTLNEKKAAVDKMLEDYRANISGDEEQKLFDAVLASWDDWKGTAGPIRQLAMQAQIDEATLKFNDELGPRGAALAKALDALRDFNVKLGGDASDAAVAGATSTRSLAMSVAAISALIASLVVFLTIVRIARPVAQLTAAMEDIDRKSVV